MVSADTQAGQGRQVTRARVREGRRRSRSREEFGCRRIGAIGESSLASARVNGERRVPLINGSSLVSRDHDDGEEEGEEEECSFETRCYCCCCTGCCIHLSCASAGGRRLRPLAEVARCQIESSGGRGNNDKRVTRETTGEEVEVGGCSSGDENNRRPASASCGISSSRILIEAVGVEEEEEEGEGAKARRRKTKCENDSFHWPSLIDGAKRRSTPRTPTSAASHQRDLTTTTTAGRRSWIQRKCNPPDSTRRPSGRYLRQLIASTPLVLLHILLLTCVICLAAAGSGAGARTARQVSQGSGNWRQQPAAPVQLHNVPYKTFYVTRACEWKSNLFVPKSNDIHFAQPSPASLGPAPLSPLGISLELDQSSVAARQQSQQLDGSRTMLSTESTALILALPITMSQSFAGYEPACSIRLIVPRNMRILAQLTSRRLSFAQQQLAESGSGEPSDQAAMFNGEQGQLQQLQLQRQPQSLWLNISHNQFIETEQRTIETEGNVLAFRFLLERFAAKQYPDTRFQVVLTAFQTLGENSDLNGAAAGQVPSSQPTMDSSAQFICDQQRLISANLACDGFKNCQDGHDEEPATCLALRNQTPPPAIDQQGGPHVLHESVPPALDAADGSSRSQTNQQESAAEPPSVWVRLWHFLRDTHSLVGFLLGFLLVLFLLTCCTCCAYLVYQLISRRRFDELVRWWTTRYPPPPPERAAQPRDHEQEAAHLAAAQNIENSMRQKRSSAYQPSGIGPRLSGGDEVKQPPPRLQSILKRPGGSGGSSQLAHLRRPTEQPPAVPTRPARDSTASSSSDTLRRGALSSSLIRSRQGAHLPAEIFRPTPAKRITRPTRPVPTPNQQPQQQPTGVPVPTRATYVPSNANANTNSTTTATTTTTTSSTGTQRVTTYHYSSGVTRFSEAYLERIAQEQGSAPAPSPSSLI